MKDDQLVVFFNNCQGRNHAAIFGRGAFYDLSTTGSHASKATNLTVGQECVVAAIEPNNHVTFNWYSFLREDVISDDSGAPCRVFFGNLITSETFPRARAAREKQYAVFFNIKGNFKQQSVISSAVPPNDRATRKRSNAQVLPEEIDTTAGRFVEGATRQITVNAYERNLKARDKCIQHYGAVCAVCGVSLAAVYGPIADGLIHVHHLKPLSDVKQEYEVDPIADLRPVCPNCHAVIHFGGVTRSIDDVKSLIRH